MISWNVGEISNSVKTDVFVILNVHLRVWSVGKTVSFFLDSPEETNGDVTDNAAMTVKSAEEPADSPIIWDT